MPRKDRRGPSAVWEAGWTGISPPAPATAWLHPPTRPCGPRPAPPGPASPRGCGPLPRLRLGWDSSSAGGSTPEIRGAEAATNTAEPRAWPPLYANTQPAARSQSAWPRPGAGPVGRAGPAGWCERSFDPAPGAGPAGGRGQRGGARALSRSEPLGSFLNPSGPRRRILPGRKSPSRPAPPPSPSFSAVY